MKAKARSVEQTSHHRKFDLFYQEFIHNMAESAHVSVRLLETLDEKGASMLEEWISRSMVSAEPSLL